jgi:hypothetical protein
MASKYNLRKRKAAATTAPKKTGQAPRQKAVKKGSKKGGKKGGKKGNKKISGRKVKKTGKARNNAWAPPSLTEVGSYGWYGPAW